MVFETLRTVSQISTNAPSQHAGFRRRQLAVHAPTFGVLVVGVVVTSIFASASANSYRHSEQTLTNLQTSLAASVIQASAADLQQKLQTPAVIAAQNGGATFVKSMGPSIGGAGSFVGAELLKLGAGTQTVAALGAHLEQPPPDPVAMTAIAEARRSNTLGVVHLIGAGYQRIGYAAVASGPAGTYAVYAEQALPTDRKVATDPTNPAVQDLVVAIYFGSSQSSQALIETNAEDLPLRGVHAVKTIPFGAATLSLAIAAKGSLSGGFAANQTTIITVGGAVISVLIAALVEVLARRRRRAEREAEQSRQISATLQRSLLPVRLPEIANVEMDARYQPATAGISVGGDWYDAIDVDGKLYFSVGDVAGHGLRAATLMGRLRTSIGAYMIDGDSPDEILGKVGRLLDVSADGQFATALCGWMNPLNGEVAFANAGHPDPLLIANGTCRVLDSDVGPPIGVGGGYRLTTAEIPPGGTLLAYTDGLIERRGEPLTLGIDRLCKAASVDLPLDRLLDHLLNELVPREAGDDIAVLAVRTQL